MSLLKICWNAPFLAKIELGNEIIINSNNNNNYNIDRRIYLNVSKSASSATELKALKPAAVIGRYFMCKSLPYYLRLLYWSTFILL